MHNEVFHSETDVTAHRPFWHQLLQEATEALVRMDADRLEELVRCCSDLNRQRKVSPRSAPEATADENRRLVRLTQDGPASLAVMARLLEETRVNLRVLTHLHMIRLKEAAGDSEKWHAWHHRTVRTDYGDN